MSDPTEIVSIENVSFRYNGLSVLEDVNLSIKMNDFLGIIGPNGGGKTTLLKIMLGLLKPQKGTVKMFGMDPGAVTGRTGYVPQYSAFERHFPISVWDVVMMGRLSGKKVLSGYDRIDRENVLRALETVGMVNEKDRNIGELSEGQQQRVFIARALTNGPELLLLDEPTSSVDICFQKDIYELLVSLKKIMAVVMVSHDIGAISEHVDKIACLNQRLYYHDAKELSMKDIEATYRCPVDIIAHGVPHRVLKHHGGGK